MDRMVLLNKEKINDVLKQLSSLEKIAQEKELTKFKTPILQPINEIRRIFGAEHWVLNKKVQLKA